MFPPSDVVDFASGGSESASHAIYLHLLSGSERHPLVRLTDQAGMIHRHQTLSGGVQRGRQTLQQPRPFRLAVSRVSASTELLTHIFNPTIAFQLAQPNQHLSHQTLQLTTSTISLENQLHQLTGIHTGIVNTGTARAITAMLGCFMLADGFNCHTYKFTNPGDTYPPDPPHKPEIIGIIYLGWQKVQNWGLEAENTA